MFQADAVIVARLLSDYSSRVFQGVSFDEHDRGSTFFKTDERKRERGL